MLQHFHSVRLVNGEPSTWWHDVNQVHTKYPEAHAAIASFPTREFTPGTRAAKLVGPAYSFNEYGEAVIPPVLTEGELFARAVEEANVEVAEVLAKVPAKK